jgi:hypothetical protein
MFSKNTWYLHRILKMFQVSILPVVLQVQNQDTLELIHYSCSRRVIPIGTARLNARRLVRMLRQPIIGLTSRQMWDFGSDARVCSAMVLWTAACVAISYAAAE